MTRALIALLAAALCACEGKQPPPLSSLKPQPLPTFERAPVPDASVDPREAAHEVAPAPVFGEGVPKDVTVIPVRGEMAADAGVGHRRVLLELDEETYLAQVAPLLEVLDDSGAELFVRHPKAPVAYRVTLRDETRFAQWLGEPKPGKLRIVQRADGLELTTNVGKLPGPDANGPSIPTRGGKLDIATLRLSLEKVKGRFGAKATEVCLLPSYGTELSKVADVLSGTFRASGDPIYEERCLVYPRPRRK